MHKFMMKTETNPHPEGSEFLINIDLLPTDEFESVIHNWKPPCNCGVAIPELHTIPLLNNPVVQEQAETSEL